MYDDAPSQKKQLWLFCNQYAWFEQKHQVTYFDTVQQRILAPKTSSLTYMEFLEVVL